VQAFVIVDGDDEGRRYLEHVKGLGLKEGEEAFMLNNEDILCYLNPKVVVEGLNVIIERYFKGVIEHLSERALNELNNSIREIENEGFNKKAFNKIISILFDNMDESMKHKYGDKELLKRIIKSGVAEHALKFIKKIDDVPSEIREHLITIDRNLGV